jgi:hypothetical protein
MGLGDIIYQLVEIMKKSTWFGGSQPKYLKEQLAKENMRY